MCDLFANYMIMTQKPGQIKCLLVHQKENTDGMVFLVQVFNLFFKFDVYEKSTVYYQSFQVHVSPKVDLSIFKTSFLTINFYTNFILDYVSLTV